jgi:hypothetical protein
MVGLAPLPHNTTMLLVYNKKSFPFTCPGKQMLVFSKI